MRISSTNSGTYALQTLLAGQSTASDATATDATATATTDPTATRAATATRQAALAAAAGSFKAASSGHALAQQQATLGNALRSAMAKAGVTLGGSVAFSTGTDGKLAVKGSATDQTAVAAFFKSDTSNPSFASRLGSLTTAADKLSTSVQQNAAISQASRYGGGGAGVMSLYASLTSSRDTTAATLTLSATSSSLTYPGMLSTSA